MSLIEIRDDKSDLRYEWAKIILDDGSIYEGECVKGIGQGYGTRTYMNGQIDKGKFFFNELNGQGKRIFPDGKIYEGEFNQGIIPIDSKQKNNKKSVLNIMKSLKDEFSRKVVKK